MGSKLVIVESTGSDSRGSDHTAVPECRRHDQPYRPNIRTNSWTNRISL